MSYRPLNGFVVQLIHKSARVRPQFVWPAREPPALASETDARKRAVNYADDVRRLLQNVGPKASMEGWIVGNVSAVRLVCVEANAVVGEPIFTWALDNEPAPKAA